MTFAHQPILISDLTTTTKNGLRHYNCGGNHYPSITSVLGAGDKPFLKEWRARLGEEAANAESKRCADRGTNVHLMAEQYLNNELDLSAFVQSDIKMFNKLKFGLNKIDNIYAQECALYSDTFKVAGRCDCIAEYNGVLSIIDFKTSNNLKKEEYVQDYYLQATFYALALLEMTGIEINQIVICIAVENSMSPQMFIKQINPYIVPLDKRIDNFYENYYKCDETEIL